MGRLTLIGTIDNADDIYHTVAIDDHGKYKRSMLLCNRPTIFVGKTGWACRMYPAILDWDTKEILLPNRFSWDRLMSNKEDMGDYLFFREMMCDIQLDKSAAVSRYLFNKCQDENLILLDHAEDGKKYIMIVDTSAG